MGKVITLGEIMLRLSTESGIRISGSEHFNAHYGGSEANVAISLANFGNQVTFASKVPANSLGQAAKQHLNRFGVTTDYLLQGGPRLGVYYMEAGIGERAASVIYDRAASSFAVMTELEWQMANFFEDAEIFHVSGITPALSKEWQELTIELVKRAQESGVKVSFDINYRGKLWTQKEAGIAIQKILPYVDYCSAGKMDAIYLLDIPESNEEVDVDYYYQEMSKKFPNIQVFYSTKRVVKSASENQLIGTLWQNQKYYQSACHEIGPIVDRVGGGDAFAAGILHGLLHQWEAQAIVDFATAASALKHTIHGDANQFSESEVNAFLAAGSGKIIR